jgi:hypothetical protein
LDGVSIEVLDEVENLILGVAAGRITRGEAERILSKWASPEI